MTLLMDHAQENIQPAVLLQRIGIYKKSGLLTILHGELRIELYFEQGKLVGVVPPQENVAPEMKLVQSGLISERDLRTALIKINANSNGVRRSHQNEVQLALQLVDLGLLSQERLDGWLVQEAMMRLQDVLTWSACLTHFEEGVQFPTGWFPRISIDITSRYPSVPQTPLPRIPNRPQSQAVKMVRPAIHLPRLSNMTGGLRVMPEIVAPHLDEGNTVKLSTFRQRQNPFLNWEFILIVAILLVAALAHGINMFHFPYVEDDEGTYMSQAWAVAHLGRLAYYTYWYDHVPFGWIQIAFWTIISGGFNTFGSEIKSGRVLMLLMQIGSTFMLYRIARSVSGRVTVAVIASLLFALSPYGICFHRRVLLDNIATFWMLLSILALVGKRLSLKRVWLSAITLGISMLSKEVTAFLVPAMWYLVFVRADKSHRLLATIGWAALLASVVSLYPLMAGINNELLPSGSLFSGAFPSHISLIGILAYQASQGRDAGIFSFQSGFWLAMKQWISDDPVLVVVGSLCTVLSVGMIKRQRLIGIMGLLSLSFWAFLARGGVVFSFYLIPLLPFLALNAGIILGITAEKLRMFVQGFVGGNKAVGLFIQLVLAILCIVGITGSYFHSNLGFQNNQFVLWNNSQADAQYQAISWVEEHISRDSYMVIDMYMWPDLYEHGYQHAHYYWKVAADPDIGGKIFGNSWKNIDYIITTNQMLNDAQFANLQMIKDAIAHSTIVAQFDTGYWPVIIRKVHK